MNPIFYPTLNFLVRYAMKPFSPLLPKEYLPRVNGTIRVRVDDRKNIFIACNPTCYLGKFLFFRGIEGWEYPAVKIFMPLAGRARLFVDVGANIGYYSILASVCNPRLQIVAVEPSPDAVLYLEKNVRLNHVDNITVIRKALSEEQGTAEFHLSINPTFDKIEHHLTVTAGLDEEVSSEYSQMRSFLVETDTLDQLIEEHFPEQPVDLLKVDTEASEHLVLRGASNVLAHHRPVILCEVLVDAIEDELQSIFDQHDYQSFRVTEAGLVPVDVLGGHSHAEKEHYMVPRERADMMRPFVVT